MDKSLYDSITIIRGNQFNLITKTKDDEGNDEYIDVSKTPAVTEMFNIGTTVMGEQGLQINNWHQLVGSQNTWKVTIMLLKEDILQIKMK